MTKLELEQAREFKGMFIGGSAWNHPDPILPSYFFWYATSAYNFLMLFVHTYICAGQVSKDAANLCPEMITWRNKVGAHFAHVFPRNDSLATRENSLLLLVDFQSDLKDPQRVRFSINKWIVGDGPDPTNPNAPSKGDTPAWGWSLTVEHEKIEAFLKKHL
ncbi:MAG: hypothetical protein KIS67_18685 [Verrucomicrobiae bacterium]|nr:hypothetical protein [Verrucomicrobiae bacterium]